MKRTRLAWLVLVLCLLVLLSAMAWITATLLRLDRREQDARRLAALEQNARLALWRMEWQVEQLRDRLEPPADAARISDWLQPPADRRLVRGRFAAAGDRLSYAGATGWRPDLPALEQALADTISPALRETDPTEEQPARNLIEYVARRSAGSGSFWQALFVGEALYFIHRVQRPDSDGTHGVAPVYGYVVDWVSLRSDLLQATDSLLADAALIPVEPGSLVISGRDLVGLPVRLVTTQPEFFYEPPASPTKLMLLIAWSCMLLPAVGVALLVVAAVSLNERRGAFVSAVTHELRTPLTTFCMYTEMLDEGMVPENKKQQYLTTLRREAERLSHLVENVLTYARIERGRLQETVEAVNLAAALGRVQDELKERCERADMELVLPQTVPSTMVNLDTAGFERILVNLVDNACKYAAASDDRRIHLEIHPADDDVAIHLRDHGPGIDARGARKLFRPFSKSDREAAQSAAGVGLGLALSRRLARRMGGNLRYQEAEDGGACFVLRFRTVAGQSGVTNA